MVNNIYLKQLFFHKIVFNIKVTEYIKNAYIDVEKYIVMLENESFFYIL